MFSLAPMVLVYGACGPRCDLKQFQAAWDAAPVPVEVGHTLALLGESCPAASPVLLTAHEHTDSAWLSSELPCYADGSVNPPSGDGTALSVREAIWEECDVASTEMASRWGFVGASGRPDIALGLHRFLMTEGVSEPFLRTLEQVTLGVPILPEKPDAHPLKLPMGASTAHSPARSWLTDGVSERVAVDERDRWSALHPLFGDEASDIVLVGLDAAGDGFAELAVGADLDSVNGRDGTLSAWLRPGQGVTLFVGTEVLGGDEDCEAHTVCVAEDGTLNLSSMVRDLMSEQQFEDIRLGVVEGDPQWSEVGEVLHGLFPMSNPEGIQPRLRMVPTPIRVEVDRSLDDLARWLGGLEVRHGTVPAPALQGRIWTRHANLLDDMWGSYDERHRTHVSEWFPQHVPDLANLPVFYPFSGPDILNALTIFPGRELYVLCGLEPIGDVPTTPTGQRHGDEVAGLTALHHQLRTLMGRNYFITWEMLGTEGYDESVRMGRYPYNGTAAIMLAFLARTDHEILGMRLVTLDDAGVLTDASSLRGGAEAIEIRFRQRSPVVPHPGTDQRLVYFRGDLSDRAFGKTRGFAPFLESVGEYNTLLKAASYLLHNRSFDDVRSAIMNRSRHVVMDVSGLPYNALVAEEDAWEVTLHGTYTLPIGDFPDRCQPDLRAAFRVDSVGEVPFRFGYHATNNHVIVARKHQAITPIVIDGSTDVGADTFYKGSTSFCAGGKQVFETFR